MQKNQRQVGGSPGSVQLRFLRVHLYLQYVQILFLVEEAEDRLSLAEENKQVDVLTTPQQLCIISTHSEVTHTCPTLLIAPN